MPESKSTGDVFFARPPPPQRSCDKNLMAQPGLLFPAPNLDDDDDGQIDPDLFSPEKLRAGPERFSFLLLMSPEGRISGGASFAWAN